MKMRQAAFTVVELLAIVVVIFLLVVAFLPGGPLIPQQRDRHRNAPRIRCVNNLKQVGLAYRLWANDNNDLYPMQYFTNQTGALLFADATNGFRYLQIMSNELSTPKILVCTTDTKRVAATNFTTDFAGAHVSYFVGLDADGSHQSALLSGDRNITNGQKPIKGILEVTTNQNIGWTSEFHNQSGNVGLADGSVQQVTKNGLMGVLKYNGLATNRILFP